MRKSMYKFSRIMCVWLHELIGRRQEVKEAINRLNFIGWCFTGVRIATLDFVILLRDAFSIISFELVKTEFDNAVLVIAWIWSEAYSHKRANEMFVAQFT